MTPTVLLCIGGTCRIICSTQNNLLMKICILLYVCHCSRSGGFAFAAVSAAQAIRPEGSTCSALPPRQTPTDPFSASCHRRQPQSYRCNDFYMLWCHKCLHFYYSKLAQLRWRLNICKCRLTVMYCQWFEQNCLVVSHHYPLVVMCRFFFGVCL